MSFKQIANEVTNSAAIAGAMYQQTDAFKAAEAGREVRSLSKAFNKAMTNVPKDATEPESLAMSLEGPGVKQEHIQNIVNRAHEIGEKYPQVHLDQDKFKPMVDKKLSDALKINQERHLISQQDMIDKALGRRQQNTQGRQQQAQLRQEHLQSLILDAQGNNIIKPNGGKQ